MTPSISLLKTRQELKNGTTTPSELLEQLASNIEAQDHTVNAYLSYDLPKAIEDAAHIDLSLPLGGIPIAIKDNINVHGHPCSCASKLLSEHYQSPYDATVIQKLKQAGAICFGRTNMDEFAMGSATENSAFKQTKNPHNPQYIPGGSSGGSAAAVGANLAYAALGSDTGGSIRQPASYCGIVGLKPSYGRVSRYGLVAFASSLDQIGPMTHTVEDAALLLQIIAGYDERDSTSLKQPVPNYTKSLKDGVQGLTLGLPKQYFGEGLDPRIQTSVEQAAQNLEAQGANIIEVDLPHTQHAVATYYVLATAEASSNLARFDGIRYGKRAQKTDNLLDLYEQSRAQGLGSEVKRRILLGTYVLSSGYYDAYYKKAQQVRTLIQQDFNQAFKNVDALISPVSPTLPRLLSSAAETNPLSDYLADIYTLSANLAGICGISVPLTTLPSPQEKDHKGGALPIGLQIMAPHLGEETLLRIAYAHEHNNSNTTIA